MKHTVVVELEHKIGDLVFLKTDPEQLPRMFTSYEVTPCGVLYCLSIGTQAGKHYAVEISDTVNEEYIIRNLS